MTNQIRKRKGHRKSREGCIQCKERHAKCNEVHPQCRQCERANIACSFSSPTLTRMPLNEDSLADLELLEHWHRYPVTGDMSEATRRMQYDLVRLGFSHHYLLNSVLGLTALQLYSEDMSQSKWYARAVAHQQAAITRARPHFETLDQTQHQALLGFSAFTSIYAVAEPMFRPSSVRSLSPFNPVDELLKALNFSRSTLLFVQKSFPPPVVSGSWLLTEFAANRQDAQEDLEDRYPQLASLRVCIERQSEGTQNAACLHAVRELFRRFAVLSDNRGDVEVGKLIWGWGLEVSQTFLDSCAEKSSAALVVLAHFAVLMNFYQGHWCLRTWPCQLLGYIKGVLGVEWEHALKWPSDLIFGPDVVVGRPLIAS